MANQPWFKLYSTDYLLDPDIDAIPREAESLLVRMWCLCNLEGYCPDDPEELARKTRCSLQYVLQCKPHCDPFFELRSGRLYSPRMEEEKKRSKQASENASVRYKEKTYSTGSANRTADGSANRTPIRTAQSQSQTKEAGDGTAVCTANSTANFNSTEIAQILCQENGWSGKGMIWALMEAIDFRAKQMPGASLEQVGMWLVKAYFDQKKNKGDFAVTPQKFFEQALYRNSATLSDNSGPMVAAYDLVAHTRAQMEAK